MECTKCGGEGKLVQYSHIQHGICFRCWGTKIEPTTVPELKAWLDRARKEYRARRDALATAKGKKRAFLVASLPILERSGKAVKARLVKMEASNRCKSIVAFPVAVFQSFSEEGKVYEIRQAGDGSHYCSCPAWRFQKRPIKGRTCKHIQAFQCDQERARQREQETQARRLQPQQLTLGIG